MVELLKDLASSEFFLLLLVILRYSWESPRLQPARKNLTSPGNYPDRSQACGKSGQEKYAREASPDTVPTPTAPSWQPL